MQSSTAYRLPSDVKPLRYDLTLTPDLDNFTFEGEESVDLVIDKPTATIQLNAVELKIASAAVALENGDELQAWSITHGEKSETATLTFPHDLPKGNAALKLRFSSILNDQLHGFYRVLYSLPDGSQGRMACTQFEATDARRAFPCWDEPAAKATFKLTLNIADNLTAISNTFVETEKPLPGGKKSVTFHETPRMSTYLLAFVVGDMASVEKKAPNGTLVYIWATRGKEQQGRFALDTAVRLLDYYNDYFGIPYPLEKLDHIAIPDFAAGAMENWGAVTYRETALLYDPNNSAANTRQRIAEIVAHEMAHMWFGDLVTMEWWDALWLNESFASWMGNKAVDALFPEWDMWTQFVYQETSGGLALDGLANSHPIEVPVNNPAEIGEIFDSISYNKGGAVLWMLERYLGDETFQKGIHIYLSAHQYGNARTQDLWTALEEASGQQVTPVMDSWIKQTGHPVLDTRVSRQSNQAKVSFSQKRFLYNSILGGDTNGSLWQAPVSIATRGQGNAASALLARRSDSIAVKDVAAADWVKVNAGQTGFYRVNYTEDEWDRLRQAVESLQLPTIDRLGLQNDAFALSRGGLLSATKFLDLAEAYRQESHYSVWADLASNLREFEGLISQQPYLPRFEAFGRELFSDIVRRVGWDAGPNEEHLDHLLRSTVLMRAGAYGDKAVLQEARRRFDNYLSDPSSLNPNLRDVVFGLAAQQGDAATYDAMLQQYRKDQLHEEKLRFLRAMARFQQPQLIQRHLDLTLSHDVRVQDTVSTVVSIAGNRRGLDPAWQFVKQNWSEFDRRYGAGGFALMRLVSITGGFNTPNKADDVESFFKTHPCPAAARTIKQSLERIKLNHAWLQKYGDEIGNWFSK
jgi:puromycin-sensitive aminopeptidase